MTKKKEDEERISLLRQGAGNYANLCGVLAGFVAVILVLVLTPGFFPSPETCPFLELVTILFSITSMGFIYTAMGFIQISFTSLCYYKSIDGMLKDFCFFQILVLLFLIVFLAGIIVMTFSLGSFYMAATASVGLTVLAGFLIRDRWALLRRPSPPKKTS